MSNVKSYRCRGLSAAPFSHLFTQSDAELAKRSIERVTATDDGFPCRVTLDHAAVGETLLLLNYTHQPAATPYQSSGPIFVREQFTDTFDRVGEVPLPLQVRVLSIRAYDRFDMMIDADVCEGREFEREVARFFSNPSAVYLHAHYARRGCFACRVDRA
jgi:hypothetical protein